MKTSKLLWLIIILILPACTSITAGEATPVVETTAPPSTNDGLIGTQWQLVSLGIAGSETPVIAGTTITLGVGADGQATGSGGCNSYGGGYQVQNNTLSFNQIVSTEMACTDQAVMQQEQQYYQALQSASQFELTDNRLTIRYGEGRRVLNFVPASSSTPVPTSLLPTPPPTSLPTAKPGDGSSADNPSRIVFAPGETGAKIDATIVEHGVDYYVLQAQQGQVMSVEITSPNNDVLLSVVGEDGTPLKRYQNGPPAWTRQLAATQDYIIYAVSVGPGTPYTLRVQVAPLEPENAERVEFATGATLTTRSGELPAGGIKQYVLRATAGQVMEVKTTGYDAPVNFTVRSPGGEMWTGDLSGSEVHIYTTLIALPEDGDYVVTLWVPAGAGATQYDVTFTLNVTAPPSPSEPPERVEFAPGATSAQRNSLLPTGPGLQQYVLGASAGQTLTVELTSDDVPLSLTIESPTGTRWIPAAIPDNGFRSVQTVTLPETGDYIVTLTKADHTPSTNYRIVFTIQ